MVQRRFGPRVILAGLAVLIIVVPFAALLALVEARWAPLRHLDVATANAADSLMLRHRALIGPLRASSYVFHPWVFRALVVALAVWAARRGARWLAAWALTTMAVASLLDPWLKVLVGRVRPVVRTPIAHAAGASFPSGHALAAVVGGATIVVALLSVVHGAWRWVAWTVAIGVAIVASACRVLLGVHYVSDVLGSWLLGIAIVLATTAIFEASRLIPDRCPPRPN
jgi:membrane-associated phospholipid phosphatase